MKRLVCWALLLLTVLGTCSCSPGELFGFAPMDDRSVYEQMLDALEQGETRVTIRRDSISDAELKETYHRIREERPDLFWLGGSWTGTVESSLLSGETAHLTFSSYGEKEDNLQKRQVLLQAAQALAEQCRALPTVYQQLLLAHDTIIDRCDYDQEAADKISPDGQSDAVLLASTAYGCLVEGKAICTGYSAAFSLVMNLLSLPCRTVTGSADGQLHSWNLVQAEDQWYHVDLTWDDPITEDGQPALLHDYFCITDEEILLSHLPDPGQNLPACTATEMDWYRNNGMTAADCQMDTICRLLEAQIRRGRSSYLIKFTEDPYTNVYRLTDGEFLAQLKKELNLPLKRYRINSLNTAVELFPAQEQ